MAAKSTVLDRVRKKHPQKFVSEEAAFSHIHRGGRLFIATACAEPQHLVSSLVKYVSEHPKALFDEEVIQVWTLGVAPYAKNRFRPNFRHNSFYVGESTRSTVKSGEADYTPVALSSVPDLFRRGLIPIDVALIQTTLPDEHGCLNLGVSVDIVKAAVECASVVIAQVNPRMPRLHGDGFIKVEDVDYIMPFEEPILEYAPAEDDKVAEAIGEYAARLVHDGDTIQVGYGGLPDAVLAHLKDKSDLGVHTEVLTEGIVGLMEDGVVNNGKKTVDRGKTVASFCMGDRRLYDYVDDNLAVELRSVDYTNNLLVIARQDNMVAINSAYQIDLTGQATAESVGAVLRSGIGGGVDFMRGAILSKNGKTILLVRSTSEDGESNILPFLARGCGVTYNRGDVHYVITEYGIAHLHGRNVRERAMELIGIANPKFRAALIKEAKKHRLIYSDQAFIPGKRGEYPEHLEAHRTTKSGLAILLRPVRISDEPLLKDFFYSLSDVSLYRRFISARKDIPHTRLQDFTVIDYGKQMEIMAVIEKEGVEEIIGAGQYLIDEGNHTGDVAFAIRDEYQDMGVGTEIASYLTYIGKKRGLLGFTATVLAENARMLHLFEKMGLDIQRRREDDVYELKMMFRR